MAKLRREEIHAGRVHAFFSGEKDLRAANRSRQQGAVTTGFPAGALFRFSLVPVSRPMTVQT
jgi:hypothetical protein